MAEISGRNSSGPCMMTSSNGNIFRVTGPLCGEFTGPGEFPIQRPVTRSFDVLFDLHHNKPLSKQPWGWWCETLSRSLWRHRNGLLTWWLSVCLGHQHQWLCRMDYSLSLLLGTTCTTSVLEGNNFEITHWGLDKMTAVFQTTFLNAFLELIFLYFDEKRSLKFVPLGPNDNISALIHIMARRQANIRTNDG